SLVMASTIPPCVNLGLSVFRRSAQAGASSLGRAVTEGQGHADDGRNHNTEDYANRPSLPLAQLVNIGPDVGDIPFVSLFGGFQLVLYDSDAGDQLMHVGDVLPQLMT